MQNFIGTKQIKAVPAWIIDGIVIKKELVGIEALSEAEVIEDGYFVEYEDGYTSWSPKDVFEAAYHQSGELSFGDAIVYLKQGRKVARKGWNGKGMFLWLKPQFEIKEDWCKDPQLLEICKSNGGSVIGLPSISMKTADGSVVPWLASQSDVLSNDWMVVK